nr:LysR family transcriptional regulator [uncultured Amphritea sp.]
MNLKQLEYFVQIAEHGSFSAASRAIFVAQPALTHQIAALETELSIKLFARSVKGVKLTETGESFLHHARLILRQVDKAKSDLISDELVPRGEVAVVIDSSKAFALIPHLLSLCETRYPDIQLQVRDAMSVDAAALVQEGKVDLGLIPNAADIDGVDAISAYQENLYLFGKALLPFGNDGTIKFEQLCEFPLVVPAKPHSMRLQLEQKALEARRPLNIRYEQNSANVIRSIVNSDLAKAIAPYDVVTQEWRGDQLDALKIVSPEVKRVHAIVSLKGRPKTRAARAVESILKEVIQTLHISGQLRGALLLP